MNPDDMVKLKERAANCRRCPAGSFRQQPVIYRGASDPVIVFIGQSPGREEDRPARLRRRPSSRVHFSGVSGARALQVIAYYAQKTRSGTVSIADRNTWNAIQTQRDRRLEDV